MAASKTCLAATLVVVGLARAEPAAIGLDARAGTLAAVPEAISLRLRDTRILPVPPDVSFLQNKVSFIELARVDGGIQVTGIEQGRSLIFLSYGEEIRVVTVVVAIDDLPSQGPVTAGPELPKGITTGWIERGRATIARSVQPLGILDQQALELRGGSGGFTYTLAVNRMQAQGGRALFEGGGSLASQNVRLSLGSQPPPTEFQPAAGRRPVRALEVDANLGSSFGLEMSARGELQPSRLSAPEAYRLRATSHLGKAGRVSLGLIAGPRDGPPALAPFAAIGYQTPSLVATLSLGTVSLDTPVRSAVGGASFRATSGGCSAGGGYTSGMETDGTSSPLAYYVSTTRHTFEASAACGFPSFGFRFGARQSELGEGITLRAVLGIGRLHYTTDTLSLSAGGEWNTLNEPDLRNLAVVTGSYRLSSAWTLTASSTVRRPDRLSFTESLQTRWSSGVLGAGVYAALVHDQALVHGVQAAVDAEVSAGWIVARAGATAFHDLRRQAPVSASFQGGVQWNPAPAYGLHLGAQWDPFFSRTWGLFGGIGYSFGDALPRDPALYFLRSSSVRALAFHDVDGDGTRDADEPPLAGVELCVDGGPCTPTGKSGEWSAPEVSDGYHDILANAASLPGAVPTTEAVVRVAVGNYSVPDLRFGFRFEGRLVIRAYVDTNANSRRDPGEERFADARVTVSGPGMEKGVALGQGGEVAWDNMGEYRIDIDPLSLPAGYVATEPAHVRLVRHGRYEVEVPVSLLRSLDGKVCVDSNRNGACDPGERPVGLVKVQAGERETSSDMRGNFFFALLPEGKYSLSVPMMQLPGGLAQKATVIVEIGGKPQAISGLSIPLEPDVVSMRPTPVVVHWPHVGRASAFELGGYYMPGEALRKGEPLPEDVAAFRILAEVLKQKGTQLFISVARDPTLEDRSIAEAKADATRIGTRLALWFARVHRADPVSIVVDTEPPSGEGPVVDLRIYRMLRKIQ